MTSNYRINDIENVTSTTPSPIIDPIERKKSSKKRKQNGKWRKKFFKEMQKLSRKEDIPLNNVDSKGETVIRSPLNQKPKSLSARNTPVQYSRNYRIRKIYNVVLMCQACATIVFGPTMFYFSPCSARKESLQKFDNLAAYVILIVCLGCIMFSLDFRNAFPFNYIYGGLSVVSSGYIGGKIACANDTILILVAVIIVGIEEFSIYLFSIYTRNDFTQLTPVLTYAYATTTFFNIITIYFVNSNVPVIMLNIINSFLTLGLMLCVSQFPTTRNPKYSLPLTENIFCAFLLHLLAIGLWYHTYLLVTNSFEEV